MVSKALPALAGLLIAASSALAQPAPAPKAPAAVQQPRLPATLEQSLYLIRSTLLTLNDANRSGNYTVLRDLASPAFQQRNTAADLAAIFTDLRRRNFDLYAVAILPPRLDAPPALDRNGMLRLTGTFPTRPLAIRFDLLFQVVDGQWRLFGISVATPEAPAEPKPAPGVTAKDNTPKEATKKR